MLTNYPGGFKWSSQHSRESGAIMGARYVIGDWRAVKGALAGGATIRGAAESTGVGRGAVYLWSRRDRPPREVIMSEVPRSAEVTAAAAACGGREPGARLTPWDRALIHAILLAGSSQRAIARALGASPSTVSREVSRCKGAYDPRAAQLDAYNLSRRPKARKLDEDGNLRGEVARRLAMFHSPRQVAESLKLDFPDDASMRISHEAIYQALYVQGRGALRQEVAVERALRTGRSRRRPRSALPPRPRGKSWVEGCEISLRPAEADDRAVPGHWEGDLVVGSDMASCLVTLVERKTRFLVARRLECHDTRTVVDLLVEMAASVPEAVRSSAIRSLTWDQGAEMADAARFTLETGAKVYFCDPRSPWQRGTNENTNGLIRQFFPKGTSFLDVTDDEVARMQDLMNGRPRETLGWHTPAEVLNMELAKAVAMTV